MTPLVKGTDPLALILVIGVFLAIGVLRMPLQAVLLVAIPISIGLTYSLRRKVAA
jgi:chromate transporter